MKKLISAAVASAVFASVPISAEVSDEDFAQLRADLLAMAGRLNALEAENASLRQLSETTVTQLHVAREDLDGVQKSIGAGSWTDSVKVSGDFRYRYEELNLENKDSRKRNRIRARAAITASLPNNVDVGLVWPVAVTIRYQPIRPWAVAVLPRIFVWTWRTFNGMPPTRFISRQEK